MRRRENKQERGGNAAEKGKRRSRRSDEREFARHRPQHIHQLLELEMCRILSQYYRGLFQSCTLLEFGKIYWLHKNFQLA